MKSWALFNKNKNKKSWAFIEAQLRGQEGHRSDNVASSLTSSKISVPLPFPSVCNMAVPIALSLAGVGVGASIRQLGRVESKLPESSGKIYPLGWLRCKCFWQTQRSKKLHLKSRDLLTSCKAQGKEAEDSFTQVLLFSFPFYESTRALSIWVFELCIFYLKK